MEKQHRYMIKREGELPTLLMIDPDGEHKVFYSGSAEHSDQFYWIYAPELEDIILHQDHFPEYTEISDEEAEEMINQLQAEYARRENKKHIIHVEHTQKFTEKGIVYIDTYSKNNERCYFRDAELEKLLSELAWKENMIIQEINYCFFDDWGYRKYRTARRKEEIPEVCGNPLAIDGYFLDQEMNYRFMYLDDVKEVVIARCRKETNIDLQSVFDDETNRRAGGFLSQD